MVGGSGAKVPLMAAEGTGRERCFKENLLPLHRFQKKGWSQVEELVFTPREQETEGEIALELHQEV